MLHLEHYQEYNSLNFREKKMRLIEFLKWKFTPAIICLNVAYFMVESSIVWRVFFSGAGLAQLFLIVYKTVSVKMRFLCFLLFSIQVFSILIIFFNCTGDRSGLKVEPF